jgi:hypothetical protein
VLTPGLTAKSVKLAHKMALGGHHRLTTGKGKDWPDEFALSFGEKFCL